MILSMHRASVSWVDYSRLISLNLHMWSLSSSRWARLDVVSKAVASWSNSIIITIFVKSAWRRNERDSKWRIDDKIRCDERETVVRDYTTNTTLISNSESEKMKCWTRTRSILKRARSLNAKSSEFDHRSFQMKLNSLERSTIKYLSAVESWYQ